MFRSTCIFTVIFTLSCISLADEYLTQSSNIPVKSPPWMYCVAQLHHPQGSGCCVIIGRDFETQNEKGSLGYAVTAEHVIAALKDFTQIRVKYANGKEGLKAQFICRLKEHDLAVIKIWVPIDVTPAPITKNILQRNEPLILISANPRHEHAFFRVAHGISGPPTDDFKIMAPLSVLPGDSGGGIFNSQKEFCGIISGGSVWYQDNIINGKTLTATWPLRASNLSCLIECLKQAGIKETSFTHSETRSPVAPHIGH